MSDLLDPTVSDPLGAVAFSRATRPREPLPSAEQLDAVADALDHLLDPIEEVGVIPDGAGFGVVQSPARLALPAAAPYVGRPIFTYDSRRGLRIFIHRLARSERFQFRFARLAALWVLVFVASLFLFSLDVFR